MAQYLFIFLLIPLVGFLFSLVIPRRQEKLISSLALATTGIHALFTIGFVVYWLIQGHETLETKQFTLYKSGSFEFFIDFYFDKITATFSIVGSILAFLVVTFSKYYMHRESGFRRYFNTILLFFFGYCLIIFSGNFETLFTGWEIIGISSFLLISFYRDRYLPVRNALKVISLFRLSDICLILAMWLCHHLWHSNITFTQFNSAVGLQQLFSEHTGIYIGIIVLIIAAAIVKSAQFPFTYWLPRAMEGPTSSSAIFYGSLSVHIGVFLLLRTLPLWENILAVQIGIGAIGLITAIVASSIGKVQPTVKTQIAYASAAQIGIIFIEIACGLEWLALFHFGANAFLRTYQLLVSPSVLNYAIHNQFFSHDPGKSEKTVTGKLNTTFYILAVKEWNLDNFFNRVIWIPFKWIGSRFRSTSVLPALSICALFVGVAITVLNLPKIFPPFESGFVANGFAITSFLFVAVAFSSRGEIMKAWTLVFCGQIILLLAFVLNGYSNSTDILLYGSGILLAGITGFVSLWKVKQIDPNITLTSWHGYVHEQPVNSLVFLLSGLGILAFPITTAFVGLDLLFTSIGHHQYIMIGFVALTVAMIELTVLRIYSRVFLGQHVKQDHPIAFKAS